MLPRSLVCVANNLHKEELMFEDISRPLKGKAKEKDVGKRRAYVCVVTSLGGAGLNLELYCEKVRALKYLTLSVLTLTRLRKLVIIF